MVARDPGRRERAGEKEGELTGPNPVDRGKPGSKLHLLFDANGLPLVVGITAANTHDSVMLVPLLYGVPAIRSRRGIESGDRLGPWRWKIERCLSWVMGYCRPSVRHERSARRFAAFLSLAATLVCFKQLAKLSKCDTV